MHLTEKQRRDQANEAERISLRKNMAAIRKMVKESMDCNHPDDDGSGEDDVAVGDACMDIDDCMYHSLLALTEEK